MPTRLVIAYAIIALMAISLCIAWLVLTRERRAHNKARRRARNRKNLRNGSRDQ